MLLFRNRYTVDFDRALEFRIIGQQDLWKIGIPIFVRTEREQHVEAQMKQRFMQRFRIIIDAAPPHEGAVAEDLHILYNEVHSSAAPGTSGFINIALFIGPDQDGSDLLFEGFIENAVRTILVDVARQVPADRFTEAAQYHDVPQCLLDIVFVTEPFGIRIIGQIFFEKIMGVGEKQIFFVLKVMVERAVSYLSFLADVSDSEIFKIILGEHLVNSGKDLIFCFFRLNFMREFLAYQLFTLSGGTPGKIFYYVTLK